MAQLTPVEAAARWKEIVEYTVVHFPEVLAASPLDEGARAERLHAILQRWGLYALSVLEVPLSVRGAENVTDGPQIFFSNHQGTVDIFLLAASIPVPFTWLYKKELSWIPLVGHFLRWFGSVEIDRRNLEAAKRSLARAGQQVRQGKNMVVFPEGTRAHGPRLLPFKKGVFHLAIEAQVPIVPVTINGSWRIMGRNPLVIHPGPASVTFHPPIETAGTTKDDLLELMERVRTAIAGGLEE